MAAKIASLTLEETKPRLERGAFKANLARVTDDEDWVDEETELGTDDVGASKFGGAPFLSAEAPHPKCGRCKQPLGFVGQVRRGELPPPHREMVSADLLQIFWCDACQSGGAAEDPWSKAALVRDVSLSGAPIPPARAADADEDEEQDDDPLRVTFVRGWTKAVDYPVRVADELARALDVKAKSESVRDQLDALGEAMSEAELETHGGVKLGGWPCWVQEPEYVRCKCKADMVLLLQLGDTITIGDGGSAWLFHCPACAKRAIRYQQ